MGEGGGERLEVGKGEGREKGRGRVDEGKERGKEVGVKILAVYMYQVQSRSW